MAMNFKSMTKDIRTMIQDMKRCNSKPSLIISHVKQMRQFRKLMCELNQACVEMATLEKDVNAMTSLFPRPQRDVSRPN
jgi:hypothetical protein